MVAWEAEDDGELHDLLNIQYDILEEGAVHLHQSSYIQRLANDFLRIEYRACTSIKLHSEFTQHCA